LADPLNSTAIIAGEYIAAEKLEVDFASCDLVEQIWVYGNSYEVGSCSVQAPDVFFGQADILVSSLVVT